MTDTLISATSLDLTFQTNDGPVHALKDVSLDINKGDFVPFFGPSGWSKTTFLPCIAGLEMPIPRALTGSLPVQRTHVQAAGE